MFKAVKIIVLLAILVGVIGVAYVYLKTDKDASTGGPDTIRSGEAGEPPVRVEEKYGFTSEGVEEP